MLHDYSRRRGIATSGCALPESADPSWRDPLEWARRIEVTEKRSDSRQCRDDVVGLPVALVEAGQADAALARYAQRLAQEHSTPVHYVRHEPHGAGLNHHAHVLYAGRQLDASGSSFSSKRDTAQDKPELIENHKMIWREVCAEFGIELDFSPAASAAPRVEEDESERLTLTPATVARRRREMAEAEGARLEAAMGGAPLDEHTRRAIGAESARVAELDVPGLLAVERAGARARPAPAEAATPRPPAAPAPVRLAPAAAPELPRPVERDRPAPRAPERPGPAEPVGAPTPSARPPVRDPVMAPAPAAPVAMTVSPQAPRLPAPPDRRTALPKATLARPRPRPLAAPPPPAARPVPVTPSPVARLVRAMVARFRPVVARIGRLVPPARPVADSGTWIPWPPPAPLPDPPSCPVRPGEPEDPAADIYDIGGP